MTLYSWKEVTKMERKFKSVKLREDVKKCVDYISRMSKKKRSEALESILKPIMNQVKQIENRGYKSVNLKVIEHPLRSIVIVEIYPNEVVKP